MPLQFNPPDWLIQEYMKRKSPAQEVLDTANQSASTYLAYNLKQQELEKQRQELELKRSADARAQDEYRRNYDPSSLPGAGQAYDAFNPQSGGMAAPTMTGDAQLRSMLSQTNAPGSLAPTGGMAQEPLSGPRSPIIQNWNSMNGQGIGLGQNASLSQPPGTPQEQANLEFAKTFPQGIKGALAQRRSSLDEQFSPEEIDRILKGERLDRPMSARGLGRVQQAIGQTGTQNRFATRLDQGVKEKGAAAEMKVGESLRDLQEARQTLKQLAIQHGKIVDQGKGGNPALAWGVGGFAKATGGAFGSDDVLAYNQAVDGMLTRLKTVTGNTGMVTEFDQKRIEALAPRLGENKKTVQRKMEIINTIFDLVESGQKEKLRNYLDTIGADSSGAGAAQSNKSISDMSDDELEALAQGG